MNLNGNNPLTADGNYDVSVIPGQPYLFTLKGPFGTAQVDMEISSNVVADIFETVDGGSWTAPTEDTVIPSGKTLRLIVTGSGLTSIRATLVPIL